MMNFGVTYQKFMKPKFLTTKRLNVYKITEKSTNTQNKKPSNRNMQGVFSIETD